MGCGDSKANNLNAVANVPPIPRGHRLLNSLYDALEAEYDKGHGAIVAKWIEDLKETRADKKDLEEHHVSVEEFVTWVEGVEEALREKATSTHNLKMIWNAGVPRVPPQPVQPQPVAQPAAQPAPVAQPPMGQPVVQQQPMMQQQTMVQAQPAMPQYGQQQCTTTTTTTTSTSNSY